MVVQVPRVFADFKAQVIRLFDRYDMDEAINSTLKCYLVESNTYPAIPRMEGFSEWSRVGGTWYVCSNSDGYFMLDTGDGRIWTLYTMMSVKESDRCVGAWMHTTGLDRCWFSGSYLSNFGRRNNWKECGIGVRYRDEAAAGRRGNHFSLKTWFDDGAGEDPQLKMILDSARDRYVTTSIRWRSEGIDSTELNAEWYSNGKITIYYSDSINEMFSSIASIGESYGSNIREIEGMRNEKRSPFEFQFKARVSLDRYSEALQSGKNGLKLWMRETEVSEDFRRYAGVDMHTGDRIFLDMGEDHAYMTIPGKGCVNAAPRFLAVNGENALGRISAYYEGDRILERSEEDRPLARCADALPEDERLRRCIS